MISYICLVGRRNPRNSANVGNGATKQSHQVLKFYFLFRFQYYESLYTSLASLTSLGQELISICKLISKPKLIFFKNSSEIFVLCLVFGVIISRDFELLQTFFDNLLAILVVFRTHLEWFVSNFFVFQTFVVKAWIWTSTCWLKLAFRLVNVKKWTKLCRTEFQSCSVLKLFWWLILLCFHS